jgi:hypothetical protein
MVQVADVGLGEMVSPNAIACRASVPDSATTESASFSAGIRAAASSINARTGVVPGVPMMFELMISAPSQCEKSMTSWPATPGKKYLLPPEKPTTSCGNTGPTTSATSCSTTARLSFTGTSSRIISSVISPTRSGLIVPRSANVSGFHHSWLITLG